MSGSLDGGQDVALAPVSGEDLRRTLGEEFFVKRPGLFTAKLVLATLPVVASWTLVKVRPTPGTIAATSVVNGLLYAHLVELQHECLHEHAYRSRNANRAVGSFCGTLMVSSFWHYKHEHLRHHAFLGTDRNTEFFDYDFDDLNSVRGLARRCFHLGRYRTVLRNMVKAFKGEGPDGVTKPIASAKIRQEYRALAVLIAACTTVSLYKRSPYLLWTWVLPTLLVAEPTHFLLEVPEHYGLDSQSEPDVFANTRTVRTNRFGKWFSNGNDIHTAHHFHQGVPMANLRMLHALIEDRIEHHDSSYLSFYSKVVTRRIRQRTRRTR